MLVAYTRVSSFGFSRVSGAGLTAPLILSAWFLSVAVLQKYLVGRASVHLWSWIGYCYGGMPLILCKAVFAGVAAVRVNCVTGEHVVLLFLDVFLEEATATILSRSQTILL